MPHKSEVSVVDVAALMAALEKGQRELSSSGDHRVRRGQALRVLRWRRCAYAESRYLALTARDDMFGRKEMEPKMPRSSCTRPAAEYNQIQKLGITCCTPMALLRYACKHYVRTLLPTALVGWHPTSHAR